MSLNERGRVTAICCIAVLVSAMAYSIVTAVLHPKPTECLSHLDGECIKLRIVHP